MSSTCSVLGVDNWLLPLFGSHEIATSNVQLEENVEVKLSKHRITLLLAAFSTLGTFLVLVRGSTYGVGVSPDSVTYISTARNLLTGNGFIDWENNIYVLYPPLFPLLLALTGTFGTDPADTAGYVNAFLCGLAIFLSSRWLWQHLRARPAPTSRTLQTWLLIWAAVVLILSPPLSQVASFAWSEPLFILLTISALFTFNTFLDTGKRASLVLAAIFTSLACLTRYVGITIPATMCMLLLLWKGTLSKKATDTVIYALIVGTPLSVWLLRNFLVSGTWTGPRYPSPYSFLFNLKKTFITLAGWVLPLPWILEIENLLVRLFSVEVVTPQQFLVLLIPTLLIFGIGAWVCLTRLPLHHVRPIVLLAAFTAVYLLVLILLRSIHGPAELISHRYLAPVYIPLLCIVVLFLDDFFHYDLQRKLLGTLRFPWGQNVFTEGRISALPVVLMALLSIWLWLPVNTTAQHIRQAQENGLVYNSRTWAESEIIAYMNENPCARCVFFSPNAAGLYFLTAQPRQFYLPRLLTDDWLRRVESMQRNGEDVYIIWFFSRDRFLSDFNATYDWNPTYDRSQIETELALETVADLADGIIYRLKR